MRLILIFLLGLILKISSSTEPSVINEDDRGEQFSWDSSDNDRTGSTQSYNGIIIQVYKDDDESPIITLGTNKDNHENIYCFHFKGFFEAQDYDTSISEDAIFNKIEGSEVDLADLNCIINQITPTEFNIICDNINGGELTLTFVFAQHHVFDYGLEYTLSLEQYSFISNEQTAKLVFVQSLIECSEQYPHSADSAEHDEDYNNNNNDDADDTTEAPEQIVNDVIDMDDASTTTTTTNEPDPTRRRRRRVLLDDDGIDGVDEEEEGEEGEEEEEEEEDEDDAYSNSMDEDDGISSDDSNEFDAGTARFVVDGQAFDKCPDAEDKAIESKLVHQSDKNELHIVFDHFHCDLSLDPFVGLDDTKYGKEDKAISIQNIIAIIMGLIVMLLF